MATSNTNDLMRVPLGEVLGTPGFLNGAAKEEWLKQNKVHVEVDWAGRDSIDLPTAWRIKKDYDVMYARIQKEAAAQRVEQEEVRIAQREREELWAQATKRHNRPGVNFGTAAMLGRQEVEEVEKALPRNIRERLYWPISPALIF